MNDSLTFRRATSTDWKIIQQLNNEVFIDNYKYDEYLIVEYANLPQGEKYFQSMCQDPSYYTLIAEKAGVPVGYIAAHPKSFNYRKVKVIEVDNMGVSPAYRSQGIGTKLIEELKRWAKEQKYNTIYVNAYYKNEKGINFYKKQGFSPIDISLEMKI